MLMLYFVVRLLDDTAYGARVAKVLEIYSGGVSQFSEGPALAI